MATHQLEHDPPTARQQLEGWRVCELVEAGMPYIKACILAASENWRQALDLMEKGCPADLAFEIVT